MAVKEFLLPENVSARDSSAFGVLQQFRSEAILMSGLDHPNVVKLVRFFLKHFKKQQNNNLTTFFKLFLFLFFFLAWGVQDSFGVSYGAYARWQSL